MNITINDFSGPLDLLLHLVKTAKMNIYEIDTKYIIDAYLEFIKSIPKSDLDNASEYLVMASELIHLKSRVLLNLETEEETEEYTINSEEDLKNKLIEYERYKSVTNMLQDLEEKRGEVYTKVPENLSEFRVCEKLDGNMDADILKQMILELRKRMTYQKPMNTKITKKEISIEDRKEFIRDILKSKKKVEFMELVEDYSKDYVVATFLSILDLCKLQEIKLKQECNFGKIFIERVEL